MTIQSERRPHPSPAVEITLRDLEGKGWHITWNDAEERLELECPEGKFRFSWPTALRPAERWADVFKRMNEEHRKACTG